jgi:hypothetical protein
MLPAGKDIISAVNGGNIGRVLSKEHMHSNSG